MNIETLLGSEIESEFQELSKMELGTEEYTKTVDGLAKLTDRLIEVKKFKFESQEKVESRDIETSFKRRQMNEERKDRWIKDGIAVAGIVLPIMVCIWGTKASFRFEKEGTITTIMGRGFISKLIPKK